MAKIGTQHGAFSWCELLTTDAAKAESFYGKLFNWTFETKTTLPGVDYHLLQYGGKQMGGIMNIPPGAKGIMTPAWGVYVTVDDVDATAKRAVEMGGKVCLGPQDIPEVGRFCVLQDPQGAMINIVTYSPHLQ